MEYEEFSGGVHFSCFRPEVPFFGKFVSKNRNCQFKLKFCAKSYSNMQNWIVIFIFCCLRQEISSLDKFGQKIKIFCLSWNFLSRLIWIFRIHFVQKIQISSLSWNLLPLLIGISRIHWWCSFSCFSSQIQFFSKFGPKNRNYQFNLKFCTKSNKNMQNLCLFETGNFGPKNQNCQFKLLFGT